jgi:ketosteroid isomerase-like protein
MTQEIATRNRELVTRLVELIEAKDQDGFRRLINEQAREEVEWSPLISTGVEGTYIGRARMISFFEDFVGSFEVRYADPEVRAMGDDIVVLLCRLQLKGRGSGLDVDQEMGSVFEFEEGQILRGIAYPSHAEALHAAAEKLGAGAG